MHWEISKVGKDNKTKMQPFPVATTELWINRSQKAHTLDSFIRPMRECCWLRLPVLLTGLLAPVQTADSLTHYHCHHTGDGLLHASIQLKVLQHTPALFLSTSCPLLPSSAFPPHSSFLICYCRATVRSQPS